MSLLKKSCPQCKKIFSVKPSLERVKYCNKKCYWRSKIGKDTSTPRQKEIARKLFTGENNPKWKGGISLLPNYNSLYAKSWRLKNGDRKRKYEIKYRKKYNKLPHIKEKIKARMLLNLALRRNAIKKEACNKCKIPKVQAHHPDYSKPLEVIWLCQKHHYEIHKIRDGSYNLSAVFKPTTVEIYEEKTDVKSEMRGLE